MRDLWPFLFIGILSVIWFELTVRRLADLVELAGATGAALGLGCVMIGFVIGGVLISPAFAEGESPIFALSTDDGSGWFEISIEPGETINRTLYLGNPSSEPITLQVWAVGPAPMLFGSWTPDPGLIGPAADYQYLEWLNFPAGRYTLQPTEAIGIPFSISIPESAVPFEVALGFVTVRAEELDTADEGMLNMIPVQALALIITIGDPGICEVELRGVYYENEYVRFDAANIGAAAFRGYGGFEIMDAAGGRVREFQSEIGYSAAQLDIPFYEVIEVLPPGSYEIHAVIWNDQCRADWRGAVTVASPAEFSDPINVGTGLTNRNVNLFSRSYAILCAPALVAMISILAILRQKRRNSNRAETARRSAELSNLTRRLK